MILPLLWNFDNKRLHASCFSIRGRHGNIDIQLLYDNKVHMMMCAIHFAGPPFTVNFFNAQLLYIQKIITSIEITENFSILRKS